MAAPLKPRRREPGLPAADPQWYKDAIFYEVRVRAFYDSDGDGIGDFRGLAEKLDYLHDLGVTTLWLLPFYPSPLRDDGYDISDYTGVHPDCGTINDFKHFLREAHRRGLRVVTELVINHTSDQHPWFQRARRSPPGSRFRNYYVWSDTPERYTDARVIFKDFEPSNWSWDPVAKAYYWHRFYAHQPDLNFDHPDVHKAVLRALDFWLGMGVDGLRLDAIPYLYEREGTMSENLPETHAFLKKLRQHVDERYQDRMLLAEANQWSEDAVAYFGGGNECHMSFHFPVMPRLFMALHMEDRFPIIDILAETPAIPDSCQWALFLRNHDELTLEMVTDEERDYMYRVYAHDTNARINLGIRRRLAPLLGKDRRRIELMNALLASLPGTPVLYYGDEIGMGDNIYLGDRNGVRTPMQWSADRNAGFSRANPQRLYLPVIVDPEFHYESTNVEAAQNNQHSLLWWMKRLIALRKRYKAFGRGTITFLTPHNRTVLAFIRRYETECIWVVANLSRFVQYVELDLSACKGKVPVELFGRTAFPPIGEAPYFLTLGPHAFYWFAIEDPPQIQERPVGTEASLPVVSVRGSWEAILRGDSKAALERLLPMILRTRRWFAGKGRTIKGATIIDVISVANGTPTGVIALVRLAYADAHADTYAMPLIFVSGPRAEAIRTAAPHAVLARLEVTVKERTTDGLLCDALEDSGFSEALLNAIAKRRQLKGISGELIATQTRAFRGLRGSLSETLPSSVLKAEQSNSSLAYGDRLILKVIRRLSEGVNPDLEVGRFLTERAGFSHTAPVAGALEYRAPRAEPMTMGILQAFIPNEGDAWAYTLDQVKHYFEHAIARSHEPTVTLSSDRSVFDVLDEDPPALVGELMGAYLETARLLGRRTAELHVALASGADDPQFAPEPVTALYQRSRFQSMRNLLIRTFAVLREHASALQPEVAAEVARLLAAQEAIVRTLRTIVGRKFHTRRIRCHGDFHLGQVLHTGRDFVIIDFEGEPARSLTERRLKHSPLFDVAGMLRSFDYAVHTVLYGTAGGALIRADDVPQLEPWARLWRLWASSAFVRAYTRHVAAAALVPTDRAELDILLTVLQLEKAIYELGYELNNRPEWTKIPLRGILSLVPQSASLHGLEEH